jgi:uncharacterized membrane protein
MTEENVKTPTSSSVVQRVDSKLHSVDTFFDEAGNIIHRSIHPLMLEFELKDICQILVGAAALSIPTAYTEEVWTMSEQLPIMNTMGIIFASLAFVAISAYFIFYRGHFRGYWHQFLIRVTFVYLITFAVSICVLWLIQKFPITTDPFTALKRSVLVALPGCFSATVVDSLK